MRALEYIRLANTARDAILASATSGYHYGEEKWPAEFRVKNLNSETFKMQALISNRDGYVGSELRKGRWWRDDELQGYINVYNLLPAPVKLGSKQLTVLFRPYTIPENYGSMGGKKIYLIPLWLKPFLIPSLTVFSISGDSSTLAEADADHRGGYMAYGFALNVKP